MGSLTPPVWGRERVGQEARAREATAHAVHDTWSGLQQEAQKQAIQDPLREQEAAPPPVLGNARPSATHSYLQTP